ncbi:MAG: hypothetical protein ACREJQ_05935, partial [bacterium]
GHMSRYRAYADSNQEEIDKQKFTLRVAVVGKEIRKERRKRRKEQIFYWVEYDIAANHEPKPEDYQKVKVLVREENFKTGNVGAALEYITQSGNKAPQQFTLDLSADMKVLWIFRFLAPDYLSSKSVTGAENMTIAGVQYEAPVYFYRGSRIVTSLPHDYRSMVETVLGKALVFEKVPFDLIRLDETFTEATTYKVPQASLNQPETFVTSFSIVLFDSGTDGKTWFEGEPVDLTTPKK